MLRYALLAGCVASNALHAQELRFTRIVDSPVATLHASTGGISWVDSTG